MPETRHTKKLQASLENLLVQVRACNHCAHALPLGPRPVVRVHSSARILIVGQAPGTKVHATGIPWNDASGDRLRNWLQLDRDTFYDESRISIIPMGYCYPGRMERGGDLAPRSECAELWLDKLLAHLPNRELTLLFGQYAQRHFLGDRLKKSLTETVLAWPEYAPAFMPLPHPSPRNNMWLRRNPWFEQDVVPYMRGRVHKLLGLS